MDYVFELSRNRRLVERIDAVLAGTERDACLTGETARRFANFPWSTRKSWSRERRVVAKAECGCRAAVPIPALLLSVELCSPRIHLSQWATVPIDVKSPR